MSTNLFSTNQPTPPPKQRTLTPDGSHLCAVCGVFGCFGFGGSLRRGVAYRWACGSHRDQVMKGSAE
jgi:hypothetical protein